MNLEAQNQIIKDGIDPVTLQQLASKMDFELDERYKTEFVAYDVTMHELVTAYDSMFGKAKGHEVIPLSEAINLIREDLDKATKMGSLKTENTEGVLLDIRQALNTCDQSKNKTLREAETSINSNKYTIKIKTLKKYDSLQSLTVDSKN